MNSRVLHVPSDDLIDRLKRMTAELSIIFISHKLHEVKSLSDRVTILRHGAVVFDGRTANHTPAAPRGPGLECGRTANLRTSPSANWEQHMGRFVCTISPICTVTYRTYESTRLHTDNILITYGNACLHTDYIQAS